MHSSACTRDCCSERKPQKEEREITEAIISKRTVPVTSPLGGTEFGSARHRTCLRDKNEKKPGGQSLNHSATSISQRLLKNSNFAELGQVRQGGQGLFGGRRDPHPLYVATQRPACEDRGEMSLGLATVGVASWTLENKLGWGLEFIDRRQKLSSPDGLTFHHSREREGDVYKTKKCPKSGGRKKKKASEKPRPTRGARMRKSLHKGNGLSEKKTSLVVTVRRNRKSGGRHDVVPARRSSLAPRSQHFTEPARSTEDSTMPRTFPMRQLSIDGPPLARARAIEYAFGGTVLAACASVATPTGPQIRTPMPCQI
ncbi:hypothetical protein EDB83DRAFT_2549270 [Lactarius deliciosus]|nr:hypothetical protein EDB83DRAFT_2549270 [Lactarius deliciosus]